MNPSPSSIMGRLSMGVARISIRSAHTRPRFKEPRPDLAGFEPGHGERIWVFNHVGTNQIIYSHKHVMDSNRALRQIPFNGKNLRPAKLRKDYWRPMALIQFPAGLGAVGRSAFQKLREFRRLHELSWGYQAEDFYRKSRHERGEALNDQKANAVADIAAVLGGAGRGNKVVVAGEGAAAEGGEEAAAAEAAAAAKLAEVTVYWDNALDRAFARAWSANVRHEEGLPPLAPHQPAAEASEGAVPAEASAGEGAAVSA